MRKLLLIIWCAVLAMSMCACYDYNELKNYTIVMGIGIDKGDKFKYKVTAELGSISDSGENVRESQSSVVITQQANSIEQAVALLTDTTGGELYFKNCEIAVIGETLCESGIRDVVDYLIKSPLFQKNMSIAVSNGQAETIFSVAPTTDNVISTELAKSIESGEKSLSNTHKITPFEIFEDNARGEHSPLPRLNVKSTDRDTVEAGGFEIIEDFKHTCTISAEDAVYYSFLCLDVSRAVIEVSAQNDSFGCEISKSKTTLKNDKIKIEAHASVYNVSSNTESMITNTIVQGIKKVAQTLYSYDVDGVPNGEIIVEIQLSNRQQSID